MEGTMDVHTEEYKDHTIRIQPDDHNESPRTDFDNMGTMVCFHGRYDLGDKDHGIRHEDYNGWDAMEEALRKEHDAAIILPIYLYDHSGLTINTTGFSCRWDSGRIGLIYVSKATLRKEYSTKRVTKDVLEKAERVLLGEVETYDQFLRGDIYGYVIDSAEEEHIESCWGFYGDYEEYCLTEARSMVDCLVEQAKKEAEGNQMQLEIDA
jgi:hypothetical protein